MNKSYKKLYRYMKRMDTIDLPYLKRTLPALDKFCNEYNKGYIDRKEYFDSRPDMLIRRLHLPLEEFKGVNHIPKYLTSLLYELSDFIGCRLIYKEYPVINSTEVQHTVAIIGQEEEVQLCYHILDRTILDLIRSHEVLVNHYKKKNGFLFGKQRRAQAKAKEMLEYLAKNMEETVKMYKSYSQYDYQHLLMKTLEKTAHNYFKLNGSASPSKGFIKNKILTK